MNGIAVVAGVLPADVRLSEVIDAVTLGQETWILPLGICDRDLRPACLRLGPGDHALITGPARSGKSSVLNALAGLVKATASEVVITAVALRHSPLREAPDLDWLISSIDELATAADRLATDRHPQLLLIDDAHGVDDLGGGLGRLLRLRRPDVHVIAAAPAEALRTRHRHWTSGLQQGRQGLALQPCLGPGRGYLLREGEPQLLQAARRSDGRTFS